MTQVCDVSLPLPFVDLWVFPRTQRSFHPMAPPSINLYWCESVWACQTVTFCACEEWNLSGQGCFFLLLLSNETTAHRGPCLTAHTNSFYPLSSQTSSVLYASSMQLLIWTVTLCLCVAAVTLSHDWRPARLLVANLRHTHSTECFLNRIVTAPVQAPSKQCSFPNCWLPLEKTQVGPSFYQRGGNILEREALISLSLNPPPLPLCYTIWHNERFRSLE